MNYIFVIAFACLCFFENLSSCPWAPRPMDRPMDNFVVYEQGCGDNKALLCAKDETSWVDIVVSAKDLLQWGTNRVNVTGKIQFRKGFLPTGNAFIVFHDSTGEVLFKAPIWMREGKHYFSDCDRKGNSLGIDKSHIWKISYFSWEFDAGNI